MLFFPPSSWQPRKPLSQLVQFVFIIHRKKQQEFPEKQKKKQREKNRRQALFLSLSFLVWAQKEASTTDWDCNGFNTGKWIYFRYQEGGGEGRTKTIQRPPPPQPKAAAAASLLLQLLLLLRRGAGGSPALASTSTASEEWKRRKGRRKDCCEKTWKGFYRSVGKKEREKEKSFFSKRFWSWA